MANTSRISGFRPVKHRNGAPYNGQFNKYEVPVGEGVAVFVGDLVKLSNSDATDVFPAVESLGSPAEVTGAVIVGSVVGVELSTAVGASLDIPTYRPASTKRFVYVADSPDLVFEVQDGGTVPCTLEKIGNNTGVQVVAGSTTTGKSQYTTGVTAPTTTQGLPLKIVGIVNSPDNESAAASQKLLVMINTHQYGNEAGTVGV